MGADRQCDSGTSRLALALVISVVSTVSGWWVHFEPTAGLLLLWPSYLLHEVTPTVGPSARINFLFDLTIETGGSGNVMETDAAVHGMGLHTVSRAGGCSGWAGDEGGALIKVVVNHAVPPNSKSRQSPE